MNNHCEEFRAAMAAAGLDYDGPIHQDGKRYRVKCGDDKEPNSWYVLHPPDPIAAGIFGCWKRNIKQTWKQNGQSNVSREDLVALKQRWQREAAEEEREQVERWDRFSVVVQNEIKAFKPASGAHDYLQSKGISALGGVMENAAGDLVLPLRDAKGKVWTYQTIDYFGDKLFRVGGKVQGCFFPIGDMDDGPIIICEGYATGATIHEATGYPVVCAMNCGNLKEVALGIRGNFPERTIILAADNDRFTKKPDGEAYNPGVEKATEAGGIIKGKLCIPDFPEGDSGTDFNDLCQSCGSGVVRSKFETLLGIGLGQRITIKDLLGFVPSEDKDSVIGNRFLCRGGSCVIVGQTSAGKSSLGMQMAVLWALGLPFFGVKPARPLKSLYVQAENDVGDTAEMFQGILLGLGLVDENNPEANAALVKVLEKNLVIIRDQTHIGASFPAYARKLVELHNPDLFWCDPLLSFFGDDINNQQAMSLFLRSELNPISEKSGIIWMMLHHTGKPSKDAAKTQKSWSSRDFAYMGLGSSELSNWARAIITVVNHSEDEFRVVFAKRGWRAGVQDDKGSPATELDLAYSTDHICWKRIPKPKDDDEYSDVFKSFSATITEPTSARNIIRLAAEQLQRGARTVWKLWDGGEGPLGRLFTQNEVGLWMPKREQKSSPYKDD